MFGRVLNVPLVSSLVFSLQGYLLKQSYWKEHGLNMKALEMHIESTIFFYRPGIGFFFIR